MKRLFLMMAALMLVTGLSAQESKFYNGFDGGMLLHSGFLFYH